MKKIIFAFICILLAVLFGLLLYSSATAAGEQMLISCDDMPTPALDAAPADLDWNSDTARVFNCYDEKSRSIKGIVYGSNRPTSTTDRRTLWARWTVTVDGQQLTMYERTVTSYPAETGKAGYVYFEYQMPDCLGRGQFHVVTDYYERDDQGHGMMRDWSGWFYAQSFCIYEPAHPGPKDKPVNPPCCQTCALKWVWLDNGVRKELETVQFVNIAKSQVNTAPLFVLWQPDELEGIIVCDRFVDKQNITVKIYLDGSLFGDESSRATDGQFKLSCASFGYRTDKMMVVVGYTDSGCRCETQKPVKDP